MKKTIVVLGGGISGVGAAVLADNKGFTVFLSDNGIISDENKIILEQNNIKYEERKHTLDLILKADEIIKEPRHTLSERFDPRN